MIQDDCEIKNYEKNDYDEFKKDFGEGSSLSEAAKNFFIDNIRIENEASKACANCGGKFNIKEMITIMHLDRHRYVCSKKCMIEYYK